MFRSTIDQGCPILFLEGDYATEFSFKSELNTPETTNEGIQYYKKSTGKSAGAGWSKTQQDVGICWGRLE